MKRFHVHAHVSDLPASVAFYTRLFGAEPTRREADYAKWMLRRFLVSLPLFFVIAAKALLARFTGAAPAVSRAASPSLTPAATSLACFLTTVAARLRVSASDIG